MTMAVNNSLQKAADKPKFSVAIQSDMYKKLINSTLSDPAQAKRFIASVSSAVAVSPVLQECEAASILSSALLGEALGLSPSPQLGQYYMVPYKKNDKNGNFICTQAQFQLGYKGYIQLALRSGQYADIDVIEIREGEHKGRDRNTGKHIFEFIEDDDLRESLPIIGYMAYFEYLNGFRKVLYWSKTKMENHADKYSKAFSMDAYRRLQAGQIPKNELWKYSSYWYTDFDGMAFKTMLRQLISKWGIMSIEMQKAFDADMGVLHEDGQVDYVDNSEDQGDAPIPHDAPVEPISEEGDPLSFFDKK
jgi:recombination protein RecT